MRIMARDHEPPALRLRDLRVARRLSRPELAALSGVPARAIEAYEMEGIDPTISPATQLADALGVTLDELAGRPES